MCSGTKSLVANVDIDTPKKSVKAEIQYCLDFNLKSAEKYKVKQQSKI